ncbi:MAG: DUF177 domain-containing protein [Actinomycetota bacterium]|nr:DUF177 domain-containing protein [Actinomycetota bacterium]
MPDLDISVVDLLGRPGEYRDFRVGSKLQGVGNALAHLQAAPVRGDLRAESVVEGVLVTGAVTGRATLECARCLVPFVSPVTVDLCELFVAPGHETSAEEDSYRIAGREIHLEPMLRDALTLALPLNPLCRPDCKGLCPHCGRNLNEGSCDCREDETDPRWAELESLKQKLEG